MDHLHFMALALDEAHSAQDMDEVPVGSLLVGADGRIISSAHNETIRRCDPSAHAEMIALRRAAAKIQNYRLLGTTLYATVEPCVMCMGAAIHARVARVVFGAADPKWGAAGSIYDFSTEKRLNHWPEVISGIRADQCRQLMRDFFARKRSSGLAEQG
ncbi:MAG: tRNA adenosine(34) deaminase TadA [Desulfobacteraceae bacterium]